ncbi:hypothetical protein NQ315_003529 [Exocentrus adspersus]|uniref:CCHC-type domain-containing protein n=1 Tax=Exocentrus adspersus TaxID=1586481 RepID=A0AAV8V800_9CUCU|nr:hypothetical protein NQ315_003529 [Exocentrus adspersus]
MADLNKTRKSTTVVRGAFTRLANELEQLLIEESSNWHKIRVSFDLLRDKFDDLKVLDSQLYEILLAEATEEELSEDVGSCDSYRRRYTDLKLDLQIEVNVRELLKLILNNAVSQQKIDLCVLYDQIETQIRALETLGITSDKCSAMFFPLIESCLPQELLRVWIRSAQSMNCRLSTGNLSAAEISIEHRLRNLMEFLRSEVENEQRISLAAESFGLSSKKTQTSENLTKGDQKASKTVTVADLVNFDAPKCIFCSGSHGSDCCFKARDLNFNEKKRLIREKRACFRCLMPGHMSKKCRTRLKCILCSRNHVPLMCPDLPMNSKQLSAGNMESLNKDAKNSMLSTPKEQTLTNYTSTYVFLQTLRVLVQGVRNTRMWGYKPKRREKSVHCLFGGTESPNTHACYDVTVGKEDYTFTIEALDQDNICSDISPFIQGPWTEEIQHLSIDVPDMLDAECGLVAIETRLGWTVMGKVSAQEQGRNLALTTLSLLVKHATIADMWNLDTLDLPSRGCSPRQLLESRWWEGPRWLLENPSNWPSYVPACDEDEINHEKKKLATALFNGHSNEWHLTTFSSYNSTWRMVAWIFRFTRNVRDPVNKRTSELGGEEIEAAEKFVVKVIQSESFSVGVMKRILRKVLRRSSLNYEDLSTILCDCDYVINSRPLTYVSNDPNDLVPITPSMFLQDQIEIGVPDYDNVDQASISKKLRHKQKLRDHLRRRFRKETTVDPQVHYDSSANGASEEVTAAIPYEQHEDIEECSTESDSKVQWE